MGNYYKYRGSVNLSDEITKKTLDRDINCVLNNVMWFSNFDALNDKNEGIHSTELFEFKLEKTTKFMEFFKLKKYSSDVNDNYINAVKNFIEFHIKNTGIFSLTTDPLNNLMWAHYGSSHHGYCIEYVFDDVTDLELKFNDGIHLKHLDRFEDVRYSSKVAMLSNINFKAEDFLRIITQKTEDWSYEKEKRIIVSFNGAYSHNPHIIKSITFGLSTKIDVKDYIINKLKTKKLDFYEIVREKQGSLNLLRRKMKLL